MDKFTLSDIIRPIKRYWATIALSFAAVVITVAVLTIEASPEYESKATISFREGVDSQSDFLDMPSLLRQKYLVQNQVAILKSRQLAGMVVKDLMDSAYKDSLTLTGGFPKDKPPALKEKLFPWTQNHSFVPAGYSSGRLVERFRKRTDVVSGRDSDLIELKGRASTPWEAAYIVNTWLQVYEDYYYNRNLYQVSKQRQLLEDELEEYREKLKQSEDRLAEYQKRHQVFSLDQESEQLIIQLANFESQHNETLSELSSITSSLEYLKNQLDSTQIAFVSGISHITSSNLLQLQQSYSSYIRQQTELKAQIAGAGYDVENNEQLNQIQNKLEALYTRILSEKAKLGDSSIGQMDPFEYSTDLVRRILELETNRTALTAKRDIQKNIIQEYSQKMSELPLKSREIASLQRDVQRNNTIYSLLAERYEELRISEAGEMGKIEVVDYAQPVDRPISPKVKVNLFVACFFGIVLGVTLAYSRDFFNNTVSSELKMDHPAGTVIGRIPGSDKGKTRLLPYPHKEDSDRHRAKDIFRYLLLQPDHDPAMEESYRSLRTAIYLQNRQHPLATLLVTSPEPGEGKSTTAVNIAVSLAQQNVRTLLVDADIRRPVLDYIFTGSKRNKGLLNALKGEIVWVEAVRETTVQKLYFLSAGSSVEKGPELLGSAAMQHFIKSAKEKFRFVIFDSSPLLPVTDATIISSLVDGVILIARNDHTTVNNLRRSITAVEQTETRILGTVITDVKHNDIYDGYGDNYRSAL